MSSGFDYQNPKNRLFYQTSSQIERDYPGWNKGSLNANGGHSTQIAGTVSTYRNIGAHLLQEGFNGTILDASSGKGYGTFALREMGFDVDDVEPYLARACAREMRLYLALIWASSASRVRAHENDAELTPSTASCCSVPRVRARENEAHGCQSCGIGRPFGFARACARE
ncbi:MAG: hypothetical protein IJJ26_08450 [Victivallales bacterium]|nr:hypothetical protein [Victivallales bacterium]